MALLPIEDRLVSLIPVQLRDLDPALKDSLKAEFAGTSFDCPECNGDVIPFNMTEGVCFQCKRVAALVDCNYESTTDEEADEQ